MKEIKSADLAKALAKKGFQYKAQKRHDQYYFYYQSRKQPIRVSISRGSNCSYSKSLLKHVCDEMHINKAQFEEFVECSLTYEEYADHLLALGKIK
jgi:hypothetical protein